MNWLTALKRRLSAGVGLGLFVAAIYAGSIVPVTGADPKPEKDQKPDKKAERKAEKKQFNGSELYAIHCGRCHAERYPTEFTASQWKTIVAEMRVRANIPAAQARAIVKYLQEDSGTP